MNHPLHFYGPCSDPLQLVGEINTIFHDTTKYFDVESVSCSEAWCPVQADCSRHQVGWPIHVLFMPGREAWYGGECPQGSILHVGADGLSEDVGRRLAHELGHVFGLGYAEIYRAAGQVDPTPGVPAVNCIASSKTKPCGFWKRNRHWYFTVMNGRGMRWCEYERRILQAQCQRGDAGTVPNPDKPFRVAVYDRHKEPLDGVRVQVWRGVIYRQAPRLQSETETGKRGWVDIAWECNRDELSTDCMRVVVVGEGKRVVKDWVHAMEQIEAAWMGRRHLVEVTL